jgi:ribosome-associated protein YbcJ (S4-like RNA binding protein)
MKAQDFINENEILKEKGISNSGGQRSDQTSNKKTAHKPEHKKG